MNSQGGVVSVIKKFINGRVCGRHVSKQLCSVFLVGIALTAGKASARTLELNDLNNGYSNCSYVDNGSGTSTVKVSINYKRAAGHVGGTFLISRGVVLYTYSAAGRLNPSSGFATSVALDGVKYVGISREGDNVMYIGTASSAWENTSSFSASVTVSFKNSSIVQWPAIGVRAGNFNMGSDFIDSAALAYISLATKDGVCTLIANSEQPPPPVDVTLAMTAPDWDLGELARAEETMKTLAASKDQLCFAYEGAKYITYQKYIINATNANGLSANGRYLLKSLEDSSQTVPYSLALQSNTDTVLLPNIKNTVLSLSGSGRTCFTPTFKALVEKSVRGGAYSDILTFTVVAKP